MKKRNIKITTFNTNTYSRTRENWIDNFTPEGDLLNENIRKIMRTVKINIGSLTPKKVEKYKKIVNLITDSKITLERVKFYNKKDDEYLKNASGKGIVKANLIFAIENEVEELESLEMLKRKAKLFLKGEKKW